MIILFFRERSGWAGGQHAPHEIQSAGLIPLQGACLLAELVLYRPLGSAVWRNSPAVETFGSRPLAPSFPLVSTCSQNQGYRWLCFFLWFIGGRGTEGCWRLRAGLPVLRVECHYQHTEASLILEPPLFSLPPAVWWDFSRGQKCARSTAINPAYCAFLWRAAHWQPLPLFVIEQTAFLPVSMDIVSCLSKSLHADFATVDTVFENPLYTTLIFQPCLDQSCSSLGLGSAISIME